jgi:hypothetical protein
MATVYALMWGQLCLYVGSTIQTLKKREYKHRYRTDIPDYMDWTMVVIESCSADTRRVREQFFYETMHPLYNQVRPHNSMPHIDRVKDYQSRNIEKVRADFKEWYQKNKAKHLEYMRLYRLRNTK